MRGPRRGAPPVLAAVLALAGVLGLGGLGVALGVAGWGGDPRPGHPGPVGEARAGSVATLADCADWRAGGVGERLATIRHVRSQVDGAAPDSDPTLSDEEAYEFFERACAPAYASAFRLYKLYNRGASFRALGASLNVNSK